MAPYQTAEPTQSRMRLSAHALSYVVTAVLAAILILGWLMAVPFFCLGIGISDYYFKRFNQ